MAQKKKVKTFENTCMQDVIFIISCRVHKPAVQESSTTVVQDIAGPSDGHDQIINEEYIKVIPGSEFFQMNKNVAYKVVVSNCAQQDEE